LGQVTGLWGMHLAQSPCRANREQVFALLKVDHGIGLQINAQSLRQSN